MLQIEAASCKLIFNVIRLSCLSQSSHLCNLAKGVFFIIECLIVSRTFIASTDPAFPHLVKYANANVSIEVIN